MDQRRYETRGAYRRLAKLLDRAQNKYDRWRQETLETKAKGLRNKNLNRTINYLRSEWRRRHLVNLQSIVDVNGAVWRKREKPRTVTHNTTNNNQIKVFGKESLSHITEAKLQELLQNSAPRNRARENTSRFKVRRLRYDAFEMKPPGKILRDISPDQACVLLSKSNEYIIVPKGKYHKVRQLNTLENYLAPAYNLGEGTEKQWTRLNLEGGSSNVRNQGKAAGSVY